MPEVEEVFRMATQKVRPDPGALERQNRTQRRRNNRRKAGVYVLVACLTLAVVLIAVEALRHDRNGVANQPTVVPATPRLFTLDLRSGKTTTFALPGPDAQGFDVSRNGRKIAYAAHDAEGAFQIFEMDADGSHRTQLTHNRTRAEEPAWSPDGTRIAYMGFTPDLSSEIFVIDVATGRSTRLTTTSDGRPAGSPAWDPSGTKIAFGNGTNNSSSSVFTVDVATHAVTPLLNDAGLPAWSPDGHRIVFNRWSVAHVTLANIDGSGVRDITHSDSCCADWSPDGSQIAYNEPYGGTGGVYIYDVATGGKRLAAPAGFIESWLDGHTLLIAKYSDY
jgi:Tol biopolymer transport system component